MARDTMADQGTGAGPGAGPEPGRCPECGAVATLTLLGERIDYPRPWLRLGAGQAALQAVRIDRAIPPHHELNAIVGRTDGIEADNRRRCRAASA